jgi:hypothetical protein
MVTKFETEGGVVTKGMTYAKLMDHLREVQDCCYTLAHLHRTEDSDKDAVLAGMWMAAGEAFRVHGEKITKMAMKRMS